jgi:hypothetical protein
MNTTIPTAPQIRDAAIREAMKRPLFGCDGEGYADHYNGKDYFEVGVRVSCTTKQVIRTVYRRNHWRVSRREFEHYLTH